MINSRSYRSIICALFIYLAISPIIFAESLPTQDAIKTLSVIAAIPLSKPKSAAIITDEAQKLYEKYQKAVYQIRVIDLASGKKSVIGSGFQFSPQGHVATNFHVVSEAVHAPKRFKIEFLRFDGSSGELNLKAIDVVHDLAVLQNADLGSNFLEFGSSDFPKGTRIFSMGNPHDLGMSIVEGNYNGLLEKSLYRKIHFSGSLNGGMSGGPALDYTGKVVGINVSTYGNQLSFLVPVDYLKALYERIKTITTEALPVDSWSSDIEHQLSENQSGLIDGLLSADWEMLPIGDAVVPGEMTKLFKCWGESKDEKEELYQWASLKCSSQDDVFIANDLRTGQVIYNYVWIKSKGLNLFRFYRLYETWFSQPFQFDNAREEDVKNFQCQTGFVYMDGEHWKTIVCARQYKKFPKLYDININMASVDQYKKGLLMEMVALGVTQEKSQALMRKFMRSVKWKK